jgi:hypothetical protein
MNVNLKGLEKWEKFGQTGRKLGVLAVMGLANMRHYNIGVNSISRLLVGRFERWAARNYGI